MRQTIRVAGLFLLFLMTIASLAAEPIVHGFFIERLPKSLKVKKLAPGKSLVLAHIFNSSNKILQAGKYQVGVEVENHGKRKMFALKPSKSIIGGRLKTFRMAIPVSETEKKNGNFRVFSKVDGKTIWSERYSFLQGVHAKGRDGITTLYTEAPPEPGSVIPPAEVPFENEPIKKTKKAVAKSVSKLVVTTQPKIPAVLPVVEKTTIAKSSGSSNSNVSSIKPAKTKKEKPARNIDSSEFKKLRTIDEELIIYVIKDGDSLKSIAQKYYGNSQKERVIANLNFIENPNSVKVGEEIIVDVKPLGKENNSSFSSTSKSGNGKSYTVKSGDTLGKIAKKFFGKSSEVDLILEANPGLNPRRLKIGTKLLIPATKGDNV